MSETDEIAERQVDPASGAEMIGAEMIDWSDVGEHPTSRALGPVLAAVVADREPRRILLAGTMAFELLDGIPQNIQVDLLARGLTDIQAASDIAGVRSSGALFCGGLDRFTPPRPYDVVVALGGATLLLGPDSERMSERAVTSTLAGFLAPGGTLLVGAANGMGLHDFLAASSFVGPDDDRSWFAGAPGFDRRPLMRHEFESALTDAGARIETMYAVFPAPDNLSVLFTAAAAVNETLRDRVRWSAGRAMEHHFSAVPSLRDVPEVMADTFDAGLTMDLAPAWVAIATRLEGDADTSATTIPVPPYVIAESDQLDPWACVQVGNDAGSVRTTWADGNRDGEVSEGSIRRALETTGPPSGEILETLLRRACAARDHKQIRALLLGYRRWLEAEDAWPKVGGERFFATPANVIVAEDGGYAMFDHSWHLAETVTPGTALFRGLRDFADRLLASASPHPWRPDLTPDALAQTLSAMVSASFNNERIAVLNHLEAEVRAQMAHERDPERIELLIEQVAEAGATNIHRPSANDSGFRELLAHDRMTGRVMRDREMQIAWLEGTLRLRDRRIRELEKAIAKINRSIAYKTVRWLGTPKRAAVERGKLAVTDNLPEDVLEKAEAAAKKVIDKLTR